jgi:hypothetical protein
VQTPFSFMTFFGGQSKYSLKLSKWCGLEGRYTSLHTWLSSRFRGLKQSGLCPGWSTLGSNHGG